MTWYITSYIYNIYFISFIKINLGESDSETHHDRALSLNSGYRIDLHIDNESWIHDLVDESTSYQLNWLSLIIHISFSLAIYLVFFFNKAQKY